MLIPIVVLGILGILVEVKSSALTEVDFENGKKLLESNENQAGNFDAFTARELVLRKEKSLAEKLGAETRNFNLLKRWPREIPYEISSLYTAQERSVVAAAIQEYNTRTCVRFVPRNGQVDYIHITPNDGQGQGVSTYCYSHVGKMGGKQFVKMYGECVRLPAMIHELGHALGMEHEHNRADRDNYITVLWTNIDPVYYYAFNKVSSSEYTTLGLSYDYGSIMHYPDYSFAKNYQAGAAFKLNYPGELKYENQRLSALDIQKINKFFRC